MNEVTLMVQQGFGLAVLLAAPIAVAALLGSVITSVLGSAAGLQDQTIALIGRALTVVLAVVLMAGVIVTEAKTFTTSWWAELGNVGKSTAG